MANTTNLNLAKPAGTDKALVSVLNSNSDKIDAWAGTTNQALSNKDYLKMPQVATAAAAWALHTDLQRWTCFVPSSASDIPTSNGYFVESIRYSANYGVQIATRDSTNDAEMYIRRINQGNWGAWQQLAIKSEPSGPFLLISEDISNSTADISLRVEKVPIAFAITLKKFGENPTVTIKKGDTVLCTFYPVTSDNGWGQQTRAITGVNVRDTLTISVTWTHSYEANTGHYNLFAIY